jgi:preprotein translocase subunit SecD
LSDAVAVPALALTVLLVGAGCGGAGKDSRPETLTRVVLEPTSSSTAQQLDLSVAIMRERLDSVGADSASVVRDGGRIAVIMPGDASRAVPLLIRRGLLEFFDLQGDLTNTSLDAQGFPRASAKPLSPAPKTVVVKCGPNVRYCPGLQEEPSRTYFYSFRYDPGNKKHPIPELTGDDLDFKGTRQDFDPQTKEPVVLIQFTKSGAKKFQDVTRTLVKRGRKLADEQGLSGGAGNDNANQQFAIVFDREMKSAPSVDFDDNPNGIPGNNGAEITGIPFPDAKDLALVLQTGALPLAFRVVSKEERHK